MAVICRPFTLSFGFPLLVSDERTPASPSFPPPAAYSSRLRPMNSSTFHSGRFRASPGANSCRFSRLSSRRTNVRGNSPRPYSASYLCSMLTVRFSAATLNAFLVARQ